MNRRSFLAFSGLSALGAALGSTALRLGQWWDQKPAGQFQVLSLEEVKITSAIVDALFPGDSGSPPMPNGLEVGVVENFDQFLASLAQGAADALRLLIHAIDDMAIFTDLGFTRFQNRSRAERIAVLKAWDQSRLLIRRSGFRALKFALGSFYCNHPKVRRAAGIHYSCGGRREGV